MAALTAWEAAIADVRCCRVAWRPGTIRGVVKQPDQTLYFYKAAASNGRRLFITVAAKQGKIFKAKCAAPEPAVEGSSEVGATLETVAKSFRLK